MCFCTTACCGIIGPGALTPKPLDPDPITFPPKPRLPPPPPTFPTKPPRPDPPNDPPLNDWLDPPPKDWPEIKVNLDEQFFNCVLEKWVDFYLRTDSIEFNFNFLRYLKANNLSKQINTNILISSFSKN